MLSLVRCIRRQQQFPCVETLNPIKTAQFTVARGRGVHSWSARYFADHEIKNPWTLYQRRLFTEVPDAFMYRQLSSFPEEEKTVPET